MTATFVLMIVGGIVIGLWLRAAAVAASSVLVLAASIFHSAVNGLPFLSAVAISFGLVATLQAGYLLGLLVSSLARPRRDAREIPHRDFTSL